MFIGSFSLQQVSVFFLQPPDGNATSVNSTLYTTRSTVSVPNADGLEVEQNSVKNTIICESRKFLVFVCSNGQMCGGWGDRQKGIISTYLLAMLMNRTFSIILDKPCDISQFLVPSEYNWRACSEYIQKIPRSRANYSSIKRVMTCNNLDNCKEERVIFINTNEIWIERLLKHPKAVQRIHWAQNKTIPEVSKIVLSKLFRPSIVLETAILKFTDKIRDRQKLICSHIRTGKNPTMPNDNNRHFGVPNVSAIFSFLKTYDDIGQYAIYVATDSENIRQLARTNFTNSLTTSLPIVHVDRVRKQQTEVACEGLFAVLLEQHILSRCDLLLLTRSNMGAMAAYMSSTPQTLYIFYHENRTIFEVTLNGIQHFFQYI